MFTNKIHYINILHKWNILPDLGLFDFWYNLELYFCIINKNTKEQKKSVHFLEAACKISSLFGIYII